MVSVIEVDIDIKTIQFPNYGTEHYWGEIHGIYSCHNNYREKARRRQTSGKHTRRDNENG